MNRFHNVGVAERVGHYSDAAEVPAGSRLFVTSGTPGLSAEGKLPEGIEGQAEQAWRNVFRMLEKAGMGVTDIFRICQYLTRREDIAAYAAVRARMLGEHRPASMLMVVPALVRPDFLVEVEVYAARRD